MPTKDTKIQESKPVVVEDTTSVKKSGAVYTLKRSFRHDGVYVTRDNFSDVVSDISEAKLKQLKKDGYLI